jgi:transcription termination factor Rho
LAEQRIWPAIDLARSGTRREERLLDARSLEAVTNWRRNWNLRNPAEAMQELAAQLAKHPSNRTFVDAVNRRAAMMRE